jgi:hypothetical protein
MSKSTSVNASSYGQLVAKVMDGGEKSGGNAGSYLTASLLILIVGIAVAGFTFKGQMPSPTPKTTSYLVYTSVEEESSTTKTLNSFLRGSICTAAAIFLMVVALVFYGKLNQVQGVKLSIVSTSLFLFPLLIAGALTYLLGLLFLDVLKVVTPYSILAGIINATGGVSAVIFLYGATKAVMALQERKRYFATVLGVLGFGAGLIISMSFILEII